MSEPLRILMVLESTFTPSGGGGAESQVRTLAHHLKGIGQQVTVVTPLLTHGRPITAERNYGIPVGRLRYPKRRLVGGGILCLRFAAFLYQRRSRYDVWHVHIGHHLAAVACVVGALVGKPVVVKISGAFELEHGLLAPGRGLLSRFASLCLKRATAMQAISTRIAGELEKRGFAKDRIVVLPNAVDVSRFTVCAALRTPGTPFTAVSIGRLVGEKGLETLLEAWRTFRGRSPAEVRLRIVGTGALEQPLRAQAEQLGIADQVEFLGARDRVEEVIAEAHIGMLTSRIEGLSNTLLEFMACGLPTVASRVSGSEDFVVTGRNGWLFPVSDTAALSACLREAEALPPARLAELGRQARADVESKASLELVVGRLLALYKAG